MRPAGRISLLRAEAAAIIERTPRPCQSAIRAASRQGGDIRCPFPPRRRSNDNTRRVNSPAKCDCPSFGGERKSTFCRTTYVSAAPIFRPFGASERAKTALALAPEGVARSNVKMGKGFLCSF